MKKLIGAGLAVLLLAGCGDSYNDSAVGVAEAIQEMCEASKNLSQAELIAAMHTAVYEAGKRHDDSGVHRRLKNLMVEDAVVAPLVDLAVAIHERCSQ